MSSGRDAVRSVAAVVVNYNAGDHLEACLVSLAAEGVEPVLVVDNGSRDGSRAVVDSVGALWLESGGNLGYGRAANLGAADPRLAGAEHLLVCNPDLEILPGCVAVLADTLASDPPVGIVGPRLSNPDGSLYPSARTFPDLVDAVGHGLLGLIAPANRFTRRYRLLDWDHRDRAEVDWVSGACFLVRRSAWESVGGFDPAYFMFFEDTDLCERLGQRYGAQACVYVPGAQVVHAEGQARARHPVWMLREHHRSAYRYLRRHYPLLTPLLALALAGRYLLLRLLGRT